MTATTTGKTINTESDETLTLHELQFTGIDGGWNINGNISATDDITVSTGTVTGTGHITLTSGSFSGNGLVSLGGGTTTIAQSNTLGGTQSWTFYDLILGNGAVVGTTTPGSTATTSVDGRLTIETAHFLDAGASGWDLGGTGTVFVENGTFLYDTSRVRYSGTAATNILSTDYYNLILDALAGSPTYTATGLGIQAFGNLVVGTGATTTVNFDTNDPALNIEGDMTIGPSGTFIASASGSFTLAGSYDNDGTYTASGGTIEFDGSGSPIITAGNSSFSTMLVDGTGDFLFLDSATATAAFTLTAANTFQMGSGETLAIGGTFTNGLGGAATFWTGSTLYLYGGGNYEINASTTNDSYAFLTVGADTDIRMWNSDASTTTVNSSGSLYSMDHANTPGDLYIYGNYQGNGDTDYWNYARDFDGTDLSGGSERQADVYFASSSSLEITSGGLQVLGSSSASTTLQNQGSGTYSFRIGGSASTSMQYYVVRDTNISGLVFSGAPSVATLSNGDFLVEIASGTALTVGGTVITQNPAKIFSQNTFATTSVLANAFNARATGTALSAWRFLNHLGNIAGENYDVDPQGDPGYLVWDDSATSTTISGFVYQSDGSTPSTVCGASYNIRLVAAGSIVASSTCNGSGFYSISDVNIPPGSSVIVYIDNETENGAAVTADLVSSVGDMNVYENHVIVRHESADPMTIADMGVYDSGDDPGDIQFTEGGGNLTVLSDTELLVWTNKEFEPGGDVTLSGGGGGASYDGTLELLSGSTFTANGTESHSIGGSFISDAGATFEAANSTVTFTTSGASRTIDTNGDSFYNIVFNGSGSWSVTNNIFDIENDFTLTQGAVTFSSGTTTVTGSFSNTGGTFNHNSGEIIFNSSAAETIRPLNSPFGTTTFDGSGSWTYQGGFSTSTGDFIITQGVVTAPTGTLAVLGDFVNSGTYTHSSGELRLLSGSTTATITTGGSDFYSVSVLGIGTYTLTEGSAAFLGDLSILSGGFVSATNTLSMGGSLDATGGVYTHSSGTILFNSGDGGETVDPGNNNLYAVQFSNGSGGWTLQSATTTGNFSLTSVNSLTLSSGEVLRVEGVFTNLVGGTETTWSGSTLKIYSGTGYTINTKAAGGDQYDTLEIGSNTDLRAWNSAATTTTVDASSSFYSQDNAGVDGELYLYGDYSRAIGTDYWNYADDFDGTDLSGGSERLVNVYMAIGATTTFTGGTLQILGANGASTTVQNQGSGTYTLDILGGTFYANYYAFRDLDADGLNLQGTTTITSLDDGDFELAVAGGSLITLSSTTLNHNASKVVQDVRFATTTAITGVNVERVGTTSSAWTFTSHIGNLDGEAYDIDGGDACGSLRWDDSNCLITEQSDYRWRNNNGGEGVPNNEWFDTDWDKRKRVTLTNNDAQAYTNAVVELTVTHDSDMQADFDDLRFTDSTGITALDYFIATTAPSTDAEVWVEVPTLATSTDTVIYMYYGNGGAGDASSGTTTFIAFDGFEDGDMSEYSGDTGEFTVVSGDAYERTYRLEASDPDGGRTPAGGAYNNSASTSQGHMIRYLQYIDSTGGSGDESCTMFGTQ